MAINSEVKCKQEDDWKTHPDIDGGWAWMIVFASFIIHVLIMGSQMALGILYVEWLDEFKESRGLTAWIGSLAIGITLIVGPIIGLFVNTCGCRKTTIIGGLVTALGWTVSAYATNVYYLFISFGVTAGIGSGMAYLPAVVMVGQYFQKRRALAQGLSTTGTGFGTFITSVLLKYLCIEYGWRSAMLIHGAINLNLCVCGALMRPSPALPCRRQLGNCEKNECNEKFEEDDIGQSEFTGCFDTDAIEEAGNDEDEQNPPPDKISEQMKQLDSNDKDKMEVVLREKYPVSILKTISHVTSNMKLGFWKWYSSYFGNKSLFSNRLFISFVFWALFAYCSFVIPFIHLPEIVKLYGFDEENDKVPLTSVIAIVHIFGKIFLGMISDLPTVSAWNVFVIANMTMCVCIFILPLMHTFAGLAIVCALMGFSSGYFSVMPVVTEDLVGLNNLANAYGIIICANGISALLGPPVAGWIFDVSNKYDYSFYLCGLLYLVGIGCLLIKPCLQKQSSEMTNEQNVKT
ncbi:monocarboxylate transporter 14-like [Erpetoichthys calabaricus]|uniref:Solute carrier family 16 member 14 n=1 Tax=Erpetoichthys calabaricus TaxID=27687 RepID=A0A8C4SRD4_ERPCA|nr:monocarboxylate transporter 14-like [Erpetoichthys calabaricus]XP_028650493.1 monocarboxylate transporter 14-like [Erpetoichthys calabaricus]